MVRNAAKNALFRQSDVPPEQHDAEVNEIVKKARRTKVDYTGDATRSPVVRYLAVLQAENDLYTAKQVAQVLGVSVQLIRNIHHRGVLTAPSQKAQQGKMTTYLYTVDDIWEVKSYIEANAFRIVPNQEKEVDGDDSIKEA